MRERQPVARVGADGSVQFADGGAEPFDAVINAAGPWAQSLLDASGIAHAHRLDIVRGSHLLLDRPLQRGYLLEVPGERRVVFVLPYQGKTLVGTTEVRQTLAEPIACSADEEAYLLSLYNHYFAKAATSQDVCGRLAGLRPLIYSARDPNQARRDYVFESHGRVLTVFGGKWTTAPSLAREAATLAESLCRP
jgi:glycerol-3-phosphate dehydrogenase